MRLTKDQLVAQAERTLDNHYLTIYAFLLGCATTTSGVAIYRRYFRRIRTGDWITPNIFVKKRWVKGRVTSVGDSDNFRLYHTPGLGWRWPLKFRRIPSTARALKDQTIHVRVAGVDAPEAPHFGRPGQPYAEEALAWLRSQILGKTVYCQLLRRDQYSRIVAVVTLSPQFLPGSLFYGKSLPLEMLKAGWATTYEQAGAEYGKWGKAEYLKVENDAKVKRIGMWEKGTSLESPAEFKRRHAQTANNDTNAKGLGVTEEGLPERSSKSWFQSWFS
ncbi:TNase-like domain-containing protein [Mycena indigotica]|uniref:TNase-like domain-containing protein n=1 Tax=Mycena indigotica TaxID=2126181 RepID=A0A8H6T5I8_9AGAR|nr:TNase-like domain-containing protein [Mycena indigotica]KAF7312178.1 TNase-like domain-containing protein [Mycena indigotica]